MATRLLFLTTALAALLLTAADAQAGTVYFVVGEIPGEEVHGDSYVLPLSDPADIAEARALIASAGTSGPRIVTARIGEGADGVNRDYRENGAPAWSWHVTEFLGFQDTTIEVLDGWPSDVERDVPAWIDNTNGQIGFWSYTVVGELPSVPEPSSLVLASLGGVGMLGLIVKQRPARLFD
jgi:hypothetical protein